MISADIFLVYVYTKKINLKKVIPIRPPYWNVPLYNSKSTEFYHGHHRIRDRAGEEDAPHRPYDEG